jgi:hypothetical protein
MKKNHGALAPVVSIAIAIVAACGGNGGTNESTFHSGDGGGASGSSSGIGFDGSLSQGGGASGSGGGSSGFATTDANFPCDGCAAFPGPGATACSTQTLSAPTLVYPPNGVLLPPNMNVLEVQWVPPGTGMASLYEVDFSNSVTDVRIETQCNFITSVRGVPNVGCGLTLSQTQWNDLAQTNADGDPVKITVRAAPAGAACVTASPESVSINFAKEPLSGGIYYWQSATYGGVAGTTGGIYYHDFGTFDPTPTPFWTSGATGTCVGCHTLSKDGIRMALMNDDPDADDEYGDVHPLTMDVASRTVLGANTYGPGFQTYTHDHRLEIVSNFKMANNTSFGVWNGDGTTLLATDCLPGGTLQAMAGGGPGGMMMMMPGNCMAMSGTTQQYGTQPNLSWDDKTLVFVEPSVVNGTSTISQAGDHHFLGGSLWSASFDTTSYALSNFTQLLGATGSQSFYYPDQSVDGNWIVYNENDDNSAANNEGDCFYNRQSRVKIMHFPPQSGDQPLELSQLNVTNGLTNSWPRWSPAVQTYKNHQILWVTFSSNRDYGLHLLNSGFDNYYPPESPSYDQPQPASKQGVTFDNYAAPQIWMAAIVVDPDRSLDSMDRSYPAFWLPFQDVTAHNHSAQWVTSVQSGGGGDGGGASSGGAGSEGGSGGGSGGTSGGGSSCVEQGATCGSSATCCTDVVCCSGTCQYTCLQ